MIDQDDVEAAQVVVRLVQDGKCVLGRDGVCLSLVDRISNDGDIREHVLRPDEDGTLCGLAISDRQEPAGNRRCQRCQRELDRQLKL